MNLPESDLLDDRQDCQEQEKRERSVQRRNDEWKISSPFSNVESSSQQHKLGTEGSLDDCQAQMSVSDALRLQHRGFEIDHRRKANIEVRREYDEFLHFIDYLFVKRCFGLQVC